MSSHMNMILFKCYLKNSKVISSYFGFKYFCSSIIATNQKQELNEFIKISKKLKPLVNRPVNEILSDIKNKCTTASESVTFLKALRMHTMFNKVSPDTFKNDPAFHLLCDLFQNNCDSLDHGLLISGLRSLLEVGMPVDSACVISAETQILRNCPNFSAFSLTRCLHFHYKFVNSELQRKVVALLKEELIKKVSDIYTPAETLLLCHVCHLFTETHRRQVELKIVELVPSLNIHEMCKVIISLAQNSNRNVTILNCVAFHLKLRQEFPDVKEIVNILYAFKKLNYLNVRLLSHLLNHSSSEIPHITQPSLISGFLTTCGNLRFKQTELLDACRKWIESNLDVCRSREFIAFVLATATLSYSTPDTTKLLQLIIPNLNENEIKSPNILLDVAWSLAILNNIPKNLLLRVLSSEFYRSLIEVPDSQIRTNNQLKLMNLKGVLKINFPEYVFQCNLYLEPIKLKESSDIENSRKHVIKVLSNFVPKDNCLSSNLSNDMGIFIDAEFIMNKNMKPLSLAEYGVIANTTKRFKPLPKGAKRFALLVMFHKDYTQNTVSLTGVNALAVRILSQIGYLVMQIPYEEILRNNTEVQKAKYLMQKITVAMQNVDEKTK